MQCPPESRPSAVLTEMGRDGSRRLHVRCTTAAGQETDSVSRNATGSMTPRQFGRDSFRTNFHTDDRLSFPAFRSVLARDLLYRPPASEYAVECIEQRQAHLWSTAYGAQPIMALDIKLCARYGGHSSTSLFKLTPRARAKSLSRRCLVAGKRMVSVYMVLLLQ